MVISVAKATVTIVSEIGVILKSNGLQCLQVYPTSKGKFKIGLKNKTLPSFGNFIQKKDYKTVNISVKLNFSIRKKQ